VRVEVAPDGEPRSVRHHGRWLAVVRVCDRYRTADRWWTDEPVARDYFDLLLEGERFVTVFADLARGGWYEQRPA